MSGWRGFLVHAYPDLRRDRLYLNGRLEDGRSFGVVETRWRPSRYVPAAAGRRGDFFDFATGAPLEKRPLAHYRDAAQSGGDKAADVFLAELGIRRGLEIQGDSRPGRLVDLVFWNPRLLPLEGGGVGLERIPLRLASIDIETDTRTNAIRAVACHLNLPAPEGRVRVLFPQGILVLRFSAGKAPEISYETGGEAELLQNFLADIREADPDVLTGWNILDFDYPRLAERCRLLGVKFALGRSVEEAKFFAGEGRRSATALVPGRQVLDALRIIRAGQDRFADYTLETVAQAVLGEGKDLAKAGDEKIAELDRLYAEDPAAFGRYCYRDAELVPAILERTGLFRLTRERAALTGVSLDKAWTSVASFERVYGMELLRRGVAPPVFRAASAAEEVTGAAGGTVLDPQPGLFSNVVVFDFRSLYPTIIRTFNIDPLSHARASLLSLLKELKEEIIEAPNGARFVREPGILPELIAAYFAARREALAAGDANAAHVYKILMNSFYGVLGTGACRYGRTELAGAITSFARKWLLASRDWFLRQGVVKKVLYGDTDSLFVAAPLDDGAGYGEFLAFGSGQAAALNRFLAAQIEEEYGVPSYLEIRFEKAYRRFLIPPLRAAGHFSAGANGLSSAGRGRAKGYGGALLAPDGTTSIEVKGMEAVRSDATPLARRLQVEFLALAFADSGAGVFKARLAQVLEELWAGRLDGELVYRKRLRRPPEAYTASTPPQVKAARALGWKGRRGVVEYVWTTDGPAPAAAPHAPLDYEHYRESQVLPVARSIAAAAGWSLETRQPEFLLYSGGGDHCDLPERQRRSAGERAAHDGPHKADRVGPWQKALPGGPG